ncbi:MAG: glycosyltransferase family 1 protein [Bacteroidetes bacterium]|nr:MAG: glycosyltransferase family 1 protein [Bacteroidota bacterium]
MKVLHINENVAIRGGTEAYLALLQPQLQAVGVESHWLGLEVGRHFRFRWHAQEEGTELKGAQAACEHLLQLMRQLNIELVHIHNLSCPPVIRFLLDRVPVVRSMHEPRMFCPGHGKFWRRSEQACTRPFGLHCLLHTYTQKCNNRHPKRVVRSMRNTLFELKEAARRYQCIVAMSAYMQREAIRAGIPAEKIVLNPYFTEAVDSTPPPEAPPFGLLYAGRLISHKGVHVMLEALMPLLKQRPEVQLHIVGEGPLEAWLRQYIHQNGLQQQVMLHGWMQQQQLQQRLQQTHILLFPSLYPEAFGIAGIEAMAHGRPVVAFDVGGVSTWLKTGKTGFLVPAGNKQAFRKRVQQLLDQPGRYQQFARQARELMLQEFVPERHTSRLQHIYRQAIYSSLKKVTL